uniref:Autophagy-related protein 2 n=1 Tax=Panagrolaimus sp. JU765 TaxID=591449 RepID=A0AC34Q1V3_9BILA
MAVLDYLKKGLCRFLIHRYMGDYLKTTIKSEDLEIQLLDGTVSVKNVNLNVQHINSLLDPIGLVNVVEGLIGEVSINVPFQKLMEESVVIMIRDLYITLTPMKNLNVTQDLMSSVIGTLVSTMETSVTSDDLLEDAGSDVVEQFANVIDQVVTRVKIVFENITLRLENEGELSTALEVTIKEMEFIDEQLETCRQEGMKDDVVTSQPLLTNSVDLNKLIHIKDVRVFTDVWTPSNSLSSMSTNSDGGDMITSMGNSAFQSCYSHFSSSGRDYRDNQREARHELRSKPIQIAHFCGEKHTVKIRIYNAALTKKEDAYGKKIEIDMQMSGSLFFCLTPSQIVLLHDIMSRLIPRDSASTDSKQIAQGGKPMQKEHFEQITAQLQNEGPWMRQGSTNTWTAGTSDHYFHELTKRSSGSNLVPISLDGGYDDYYSSTGSNFRYDSTLDSDSVTEIGTQRGSNSTLIERINTKPPDVFILAIRVPNVFGVVTHEDPLSKENTEKILAEDGLDGISKIIDNLGQISTQFFQSVINLRLTSNPLYLQRKNFSKAYSGDHIRLLAQTASFRLNSESNGSRDSLTVNAVFSKFDLIESLTKETNHGSGKNVNIDLLKFGDNTDVALHLMAMMNQENEIDYSIEINCQACQSEIDPSIIDRLHNLIVPRPFFLSSAKSVHYEKNYLDSSENVPKCRVRFYCPKWEVDLRIPVADVENRVPFWHRNVYDEFTRIEFNELRLDMPKFKFTDISNFGTIHINSHSMTATLMGDSISLECSDDERKFLHTTNLIGDTHVFLAINYDFRNKSINANTNRLLDPLTKSMTQSMHGSFFKFNDEKEDGPFARGNEFIDDTKLLLAGNRAELADFSDGCRKMSDVNIELSLPRLHLYFPSKKFFEVLYNRFANDFALFAPRAPIFKSVNNELGSQNSNGPIFRPFTNDDDDEFGASEYEDTREAVDKSSLAHKMSLTVKVNKGNVLIGAVGDENEAKFPSQIGSELDKTDFFLVFGYHGDPNLMYMYIAADKSSILHRNLFDNSCRPFDTNVSDLKTFMRRNLSDVFAEPLTTNEFCPLHDDNNIVVAMKIFTHYDQQAERDFKNIVLAVAVRNTLTHFRPFTNPEHFWVSQLTKFFAVEDYGVPGYEWPQVIIDLNVHFTNLVVAYDHCNVVPDSPLKLRVAIGSCDLASNIVQSMERFKFHCFLEETKMFIAAKKKDTVRFQGYDYSEAKQKFVKFLGFGMLKLELNYSLGNPESDDPNERCPNIEIICSNDVLKAWLCTDTVVESINMLIDFLQSDFASALNNKKEEKTEPVAEFVKAAANFNAGQMNSEEVLSADVGDDRNRVLKLMSSAMEDQPQFSKQTKASHQSKNGFSSDDETITLNLTKETATNNADKSSSSTDDEFIVVDEIPGSGITQPSGAPRVRILDNSFEMVSEFMCTPDHESEIMKLPKGHPSPILKYSIRDFSVQLYLYGGNDLGNAPSEVKPYSQWEQKRESNQCMRDGSVGGPYRDHTVCVQAQILRISFVAEVFGPTAPILSRNMLTIYDIELKDHLLVSQINKLFYQFTSELLPRRSFAPMVSIKVVEDQNREGRIKVSMLPMRLNVDQDTLEFLQDFFVAVGNGLKLPSEAVVDPALERPVFEVPVKDLSELSCESDVSENRPMDVDDILVEQNAMVDRQDNLYSDLLSDIVPKPLESPISSSNDVVDQKCSSESLKETFFKSFVFSPGCKIRLDYVGKRVKMDHEQGTVAGLLLGLSKLHCTELILKDLHNEKGLLGYGKCVQFAVEEWVNDIQQSQLTNVIGSFGPITSLVEIARGITDLFYIPLTEFRKEDGRIVKGIQRGASSFGVSAASAAIDTTQWFASVVHSIAEIAFDIVTPDYQAAQRARREQENQQRVPNDFREGLHMAMGTVYEGVLNSAQTLQMATQEDRAHGQWPIRGILRNATPMAVKPIVIATQATMHVLGGIKSQLRPDSHREEIDKWKHLNRT